MGSPNNRYMSKKHGRDKKATPKAAAAAAAAKQASENKAAKEQKKVAQTNYVSDTDHDNIAPCGICVNMITKDDNNPILCDSCQNWCHIECTDLDIEAYSFLQQASKKHTGIKWFCSKCVLDPITSPDRYDRHDEHTAIQDGKIDKLGEMFELMQKKMDSVLSQIGTNRVESENKMGVHVQEVLNDHREIDEKKCNMMVFNLPESTNDLEKLKALLTYVNKDVNIESLNSTNVSRLGKPPSNEGRPRPLKIVFNDAETKWQFIKKASSLRNSEEFKKVGLSLDKTTKERQEDMALRAKLLEEKKKRPDDDLVIFRKEIVKRVDIDNIKKQQRLQASAGLTNGDPTAPGH